MPGLEDTYTYRGGKKIPLVKQPDQFVVRATPSELVDHGITGAKQVSSRSSRVTVRGDQLDAAMSAARGVAPTHHAYSVADSGDDFLITDRVLVTFKEPPTPQQLSGLMARYALILNRTFSERDYLFQLTDHTGMNPVKLVVKLNEDEKLVKVAEHDLNVVAKRYQLAVPTDPYYERQWHLHTRLGHPQFDRRASSNCEEAWRLLGNFGSADVVIAVTDDGCRLDHPDFDSPTKFAGWGYMQRETLVVDTSINADPERMGTWSPWFGHGRVDAAAAVTAARQGAPGSQPARAPKRRRKKSDRHGRRHMPAEGLPGEAQGPPSDKRKSASTRTPEARVRAPGSRAPQRRTRRPEEVR